MTDSSQKSTKTRKASSSANKSDRVELGLRANLSDVRQNYDVLKTQLLEVVPQVMLERFYEMYKDAWNYATTRYPDVDEDTLMDKTIAIFQQMMGDVHNWREDRILEEAEHLNTELPYFREALRQLLIARVTILLSVRHDRRTDANFEFVMPPDTEIAHTLYKRASKRLRARARLFVHTLDEVDVEQNTGTIEEIIQGGLEKSITCLVPLQQVVETHYAAEETSDGARDDDDDNENDDDEDNEDDDSGMTSGEFSADEEEDYEEEIEEEEESGDTEDEDDDEDEEDEDDDASAKSVHETPSTKVPLVPEDAPADRSAKETAVFSNDSSKEIKLKTKMSQLQSLIEDLHDRRARVPKKHKTLLRSMDEEIAEREEQLARTKKRLQKM